MKPSFFNFSIQDFEHIKSLQQLRERLLNRLLLSAFIIGSPLLVIAMIPAFQRGMIAITIIYAVLYLWLIVVTFVRRLPSDRWAVGWFTVRTTSWLSFFFELGLVNLYLSGFNVDAGLCFLTFVSMTALFFDLRRGMLALGISSVTILLASYAAVVGGIPLKLGLPQSDPFLWVIGGIIFLITGIFLIFSLTALVRGLLVNLTKATSEAEKLEEANRALRASEERYRSLVEISPDLVTLIGLDGKIILTNQPGLALFGYESLEQVAGNDFLSFIAPEDRPRLAQAFQRTLDGGEPSRQIVCQCIRKDGALFHAEFSSSRILGNGAPQAVIGVGRDISARRQAEQALRDARDQLENRVRLGITELQSANERLRELVAHSPAVIFAARVGKNYPATFYSENVRDLLGYSPQEFTADPNFWAERIHPQDVERVFAETARIFETGEVTLEYRFRHANGEYRWMRDAVRLVRAPDGTPHELVGSLIDISAKKQAEAALRESEETGRVILNATSASLSLMDSDGTVLAANNITAQRLGKKLDQILGKSIYQFFPEVVARSRKTQIDKVFRTGEALHYEDTREGIWFENHIYPILDALGQVVRVVVSARDVTERKRMEQSLAQARDELEQRVVERTWKLLETQEQLRNLTKEVILAQEEERRNVSRELHDEAGQALVSMKYGLESILSELPADSSIVQQRLASALQQLDQTTERIRHLAHSLRPPLFDIADLDLTLKDYCLEFSESTGLQIEYVGAPAPGLSEEAGLSFFRFMQEALTNIVKHAKATRVDVKLSQLASQLSLSVADNGVGAPDTRSDGRGHIGMRERFMMLNGKVQIQSGGPSGFVITASIPHVAKNDQTDTSS